MLKLMLVFMSACILACGTPAKTSSQTTTVPPVAAPEPVPEKPDTPVRLRIGNLGCSLVLPSANWLVTEGQAEDGSPQLKIDLQGTSLSLIVFAISNADAVPIEHRLEGERLAFVGDPKIDISPVAEEKNGRWAFAMESQAEHGGTIRGKVYAVPLPGRNDVFFLVASMGLAQDYEANEDAVDGILNSIELAQ